MGLHSNQSVTKSTKEKGTKPKMHFLALTLIATGASALTLTKDLKAASPLVNLGCQCSSLTFVDSQGQVQGNCRSVDSTGARWCYVDHLPSSCQDLSHSARFPANPWSYEACSTPPENSGHHHHVQPAYTALSTTSLPTPCQLTNTSQPTLPQFTKSQLTLFQSTTPQPTPSPSTSRTTSTAPTPEHTRMQVRLPSRMQPLVKQRLLINLCSVSQLGQ